MRICLYGAASPTIDPAHIRATEELGRELARRGHSLVFGGGGHPMAAGCTLDAVVKG